MPNKHELDHTNPPRISRRDLLLSGIAFLGSVSTGKSINEIADNTNKTSKSRYVVGAALGTGVVIASFLKLTESEESSRKK